jgi:hypothetical protein
LKKNNIVFEPLKVSKLNFAIRCSNCSHWSTEPIKSYVGMS